LNFDAVVDFAHSVAIGVRYARLFSINGVPILDIIVGYVMIHMGLNLFVMFIRAIKPASPGIEYGSPFRSEDERMEFTEFFQGEDQAFDRD